MSGEAATETQLTEAEMAEAEVRVDEQDHNPDIEFDSLFDEDVPESELQGESEETTGDEKPADTEPKGEDEKPAEQAKEETAEEKQAAEAKAKEEADAKAAEEAKAKEKPEEVDYSKPPPTGYVAIPALKESRRETEAVKQQLNIANQNIQALQAQASKPKEQPEGEDEFKDFELLSDKDFEELVNEDVEEALIYKNKFDRYKDVQAEKKQLEQAQRYVQQQVESVINKSVERINSEVPGIYEEGNPVASELFDFAVENGFSQNFLNLLTAPATRIIPVDRNGNVSAKSYPLGDGAASLVTMLHKLNQASKNSDPESLRSEIEAEIRKDEREKATKEITQELIEKFKNETTGTTFTSIGDAPGGSDDAPGEKTFYTEADFAKMTPEQERKALGG